MPFKWSVPLSFWFPTSIVVWSVLHGQLVHYVSDILTYLVFPLFTCHAGARNIITHWLLKYSLSILPPSEHEHIFQIHLLSAPPEFQDLGHLCPAQFTGFLQSHPIGQVLVLNIILRVFCNTRPWHACFCLATCETYLWCISCWWNSYSSGMLHKPTICPVFLVHGDSEWWGVVKCHHLGLGVLPESSFCPSWPSFKVLDLHPPPHHHHPHHPQPPQPWIHPKHTLTIYLLSLPSLEMQCQVWGHHWNHACNCWVV